MLPYKAIEILENYHNGYFGYKIDDVHEAHRIAIEAIRDSTVIGKCKTCKHRDPEDKKCDCGELERAGCPFPVSDDYYCKYYEKED